MTALLRLVGLLLPAAPEPHVCRTCARTVRRLSARQRGEVEVRGLARCGCGGELWTPDALAAHLRLVNAHRAVEMARQWEETPW